MRVAIATDHNGVNEKKQIIEQLKDFELIDYSPVNTDTDDYPDFAIKVGEAVANKEVSLGILMCGTGIGMSIAANKVKGVRCAHCSSYEQAHLAREHNNANILAFGARVIGIETAKMILDEWLNAEFKGGRHQDRVDMIMAIEERQ